MSPENAKTTACQKAERNTRQKETVKRVFCAMRNHPTADMVYEMVEADTPGIGRATVYRILNLFVKNGIAIKVPITDGADRYDITVVPHSHAKCRRCGAVIDVETDGLLPKVTKDNGFQIEGGSVQYYGLCPDCK